MEATAFGKAVASDPGPVAGGPGGAGRAGTPSAIARPTAAAASTKANSARRSTRTMAAERTARQTVARPREVHQIIVSTMNRAKQGAVG